MIANKLKAGDEIRVIAPARSLGIIDESTRNIANKCLEKMGLKVTFSKNCEKIDEFSSSSIQSRVNDLHEAFLDDNVKCILTVIGGFNSNQLLDYIDYDIIKNNPKIICGYSDITILSNAIYKITGLVTYSGPHYSTFGMEKGIDYTIDYFKKCLMSEEVFELTPSEKWSDDMWFLDQNNRMFYENNGYITVNKGSAKGEAIGGNLCTLNLLQGTKYMPDLKDKIVFIEDTSSSFAEEFDRDLQSLIHQPDFDKVKGIVIGRFQVGSKITKEKIIKIIKTKKELNNIPVIADVDFGHTTPHITFPIGGEVEIVAEYDCSKILISKH
ncbi:S66 family peptidase [Tepidibacter aestuarii]|uniref:S66 family peptidase n=1 Tax=Tepidibacter aestuarii TaxID=2925782 RepID=UPI0020C14189|nr:S66 peptidase family protein [Tepidibacter aestuarii]CAH2213114.1 putative carboxypeptidase; aminoacid adenylate hydrolase (microcin resistance) [Tepidibacter aestuarii]